MDSLQTSDCYPTVRATIAAVGEKLVSVGLLTRERMLPWCVESDRRALGSGYYASVYALGDRIVKITDDERDAWAAYHVRNLQQRGGGRNLVRVDHVLSFGNGYDQYYAIVNERLDSLPRNIQMAAANNGICGTVGTTDLIRGGQQVIDGWYRPAESWWSKPRMWEVVALNFAGVRDDLIAAGVTEFSDWHQYNIMWRPAWRDPSGYGRVVLVDFGCSTSPRVDRFDP